MSDITQTPSQAKWQFWIDRGGTFTDIVARSPSGVLHSHKLLSDNPEQYDDAALAGIRYFLGLAANAPIPAERVESVKMGTTVATNALLERKGAATALVITTGFADALSIAYQHRPKLFDRHIKKPTLLYSSVIEADERIHTQGEVLTPLNIERLRAQLEQVYAQGIRSVAIVFMHAYLYPDHERQAYEVAKTLGFTQISCSHRVSPMIKLVGRGDTTVVDAYLSPILRQYVDRVAESMPGVPLFFMQSSGALTMADQFQGKDAILSGPAGGIVGMAKTGLQAGISKLIGFDMGGTSTDVSHFAGEYERAFETQVAGVRMRVPMMNIHTVAAGGGSIIRFDGERLRVGPESAGAHPGPACYRGGGPLTITDANVLLGKIQPDVFPPVFGPNADQPLDRETVMAKFAELSEQTGLSPEQTAEGSLQIAVEQMANAIKNISVARGYDVSEYTLQCFGGAGAQHACLVAEALGITQVFIHSLAGVLSAFGMGLADQGVIREQSVNMPLDEVNLSELMLQLDNMTETAIKELDQQFRLTGKRHIRRWLHIRYEGSDLSLPIQADSLTQMQSDFAARYQQRFAFLQPDKGLVVEALSVEVTHQQAMVSASTQQATQTSTQHSATRFYSQGAWHVAKRYQRSALKHGQKIIGPAIILEQTSTTVLEPGWSLTVDEQDNLRLHHEAATHRAAVSAKQVDPVMLEVFNNQFMAIAEQMGLQLQNTAASVNIKERLDFSCALFDGRGQLVANAPHVPVHLGSMGESVASVMTQYADTMTPGDVYLINDPYHGGTHLPDMTVITPVFISGISQPDFYVGSRGHHADIGGMTPGSMPAMSTHIDQEGIRFSGFQLVRNGQFREQALREALKTGQYPARNPEQNIADLRAQIAANEKGVTALKRLCEQYSSSVVSAYMGFVQANAEAAVRKVVAMLKPGVFNVKMDNSAEIHVALEVDANKDQITLDFTGTSAQQAHNFNAPKAVTIAAVLFVFRTLVDDDIPLNAGCLRPIRLIVPKGSLLNPDYPAAVVAGNVETSSCVTNALYGVLGLQASAQPTMNNLTFGNEQYQYYETLAGGSGAGEGFNGTDVVQTLMTNSRLTDPEVLEQRFPVRVCHHRVRPDSGGQGQWYGGNGAIRRLLFEQAMTVTVLSNGRIEPAFGLHGGNAGEPGENWLIRASGETQALPSSIEISVGEGDQIEILTPGGGGFGSL